MLQLLVLPVYPSLLLILRLLTLLPVELGGVCRHLVNESLDSGGVWVLDTISWEPYG